MSSADIEGAPTANARKALPVRPSQSAPTKTPLLDAETPTSPSACQEPLVRPGRADWRNGSASDLGWAGRSASAVYFTGCSSAPRRATARCRPPIPAMGASGETADSPFAVAPRGLAPATGRCFCLCVLLRSTAFLLFAHSRIHHLTDHQCGSARTAPPECSSGCHSFGQRPRRCFDLPLNIRAAERPLLVFVHTTLRTLTLHLSASVLLCSASSSSLLSRKPGPPFLGCL